MHDQNKNRIVLIGKCRTFFKTVRAALQVEVDIEVVSCAVNLEQAVASASDGHMAIIDGAAYGQEELLELLQKMRDQCASLRLIVADVDSSTDSIVPLIEAGAAGYIGREQMPDQLAHTVRSVSQEALRLPPEVTTVLMSRLTELHKSIVQQSDGSPIIDESLMELTPREREVLELVQEGMSNREIAKQLTIEYGTVKNHVHNILRKLNVSSRQEAAKIYSILAQDV